MAENTDVSAAVIRRSTRGNKRPIDDTVEIVDLDDDDDNDDDEKELESLKNNNKDNPSKSSQSIVVKKESQPINKRLKTNDDDDTKRPAISVSDFAKTKEKKKNGLADEESDGSFKDSEAFAVETSDVHYNVDEDEDEDVMVVDPPPVTLCAVAAATANHHGDDDEIEITGYKNQMLLPHLRQYCTEVSFVILPKFQFQCEAYYIPKWARDRTVDNAKKCDLCYCYVCDKPAKECQRWSSSEYLTAYYNHCLATEDDKSPHSKYWKEIRMLHKDDTEFSADRLESLEYLGMKMDFSSYENGDDDDEEECDDDVKPPAVATVGNINNNNNNNNNNHAIEMHQPQPQQQARHVRYKCEKHEFTPLPKFEFTSDALYIPRWARTGTEGNAQMCDSCYCYVCNKPANDCVHWSSTEYPTASNNHCHATRCGPQEKTWNEMRSMYQSRNRGINRDRFDNHLERGMKKDSNNDGSPTSLPLAFRVGGFAPTDERASPYFKLLSKCRKCGWFSNVGTKGQTKHCDANAGYHPAEWCHSCGRIALKKCLNTKSKCQPYQPKPSDISLGTKTIPFRIRVHDPRKMKMFQSNWALQEGKSPKWKYDEEEEEDDMFQHRFATYPTLSMILASIPVLREDRLPTDGTFRGWNKDWVKAQMMDENSYNENCWFDKEEDSDEESDDDDNDDQYQHCLTAAVQAEDTDAVLMDRNNILILQELHKFHTVGFPKSDKSRGSIAGDIVANWNRKKRCGEFIVRLFYSKNDCAIRTLGPLFGAWFGVSPFPLSSLTCRMTATCDIENNIVNRQAIPPFRSKAKALEVLRKSADDEMNKVVTQFNQEVEASQAKVSLKSSLGDDSYTGGVCSADVSFSALLQRYFAELLPQDVASQRCWGSTVSWSARTGGVSSYHRTMANRNDRNFCGLRTVSLESYVREEDIPLACQNLYKNFASMSTDSKSISQILVHLENLGHEEAPFEEGLNVELLPFQRQTLQWALDREKAPGGLQSFLWTKLPSMDDVYYLPVLESVCRQKPKLVRGGIIADEMGLGKTVVSLALILQNPAPLTPKSGSKPKSFIPSANSETGEIGWDPDWQREGTQNPLKASIVSRGTLVVCHLSLVSQWIEEAKSKLKNPGLVYAYHGQNRKRDAMILAQNAIIVTTYATLAKDASYHAGRAAKLGNSGYCPPCEQIRWWRIICDESHSLKQDTLQTKAVMELIGDHKWAVSGTPWNTSLADIKNQLKFIGLEYVEKMFSDFQKAVFVSSCRYPNPKKYLDDRKLGHFLFLMRAVMIRHAQNQQYRGTSTTLMSLPPKTERSIMIEFEPGESTKYSQLEKEALIFYRDFKKKNDHQLGSHYLKLMQRLTVLRISCAGGRIPLEVEGDGEEMDNAKKKKTTTKKKARAFSLFSFQSKFATLIEELKRIRDVEPDSKSLVFSQFASSLKFLQDELPKHGFQFRTLTGDMSLKQRADALRTFQHDPPTTIFLLSMRSGAVGINLTQANRVFLLEPSMNPSLEAQAVGRVHRLGQTRPVEVVRLLMKDSIDTKIRQLVDKKYARVKSSSVAAAEKDSDDDDDPDVNTFQTAHATNPAIVGSMRTEKAALMSAEFDFLFGLSPSLDPAPFAVYWPHDDDDYDDNDIDSMIDFDEFVPDCVKSEF